MHPSLAQRYRLRSAEDIALAERMMAAAKKAGWSDRQIEGLLQYYGTLAPALESGQVSREAALHQLWDFAGLQGIGEEQRAALLDWHGATDAFMGSHGGELPALDRPAPAAIAAELAEIEKIQREDPDRYWREQTLQNRMYDLLEQKQSRGADAPPAVASPAHVNRLTEIESMMGDQSSAYWRGATAPALQAEYRNILSLAAPDTPSGGGEQAAGGGAGGPGGTEV
jgi:hypothetical protein